MQVVVWGAGPGGVAAALTALRRGDQVTVIEAAHLGGNALHHSLVPSKVLLEAAAAQRWDGPQSDAGRAGQAWQAWMAHQRRLITRVQADTAAALAGSRLVIGTGQLVTDGGQVGVAVNDRVIHGDVLIIATGSVAVTVPGMAPDGRRVWLPRALAQLSAPPAQLTIVGAGPTGLEAAALFARAGSQVALFTPYPRLLPDWSSAVAAGMAALLDQLGVAVYYGHHINRLIPEDDPDHVTLVADDGRRYSAGPVLLATGRRPALDPEKAQAIGLAVDFNGFLAVDDCGRTSLPGVWAVGDAAGPPLLANKAREQGRRAVEAAAGAMTTGAPPWVEAIYTHPDVARCGQTPGRGLPPGSTRWESRPSPLTYRRYLSGHPAVDLYLAVYTDADGARVLGGEAIGAGAAEVMNMVATARAAGLPVERLTQLGWASPTHGEWLAELRLTGAVGDP